MGSTKFLSVVASNLIPCSLLLHIAKPQHQISQKNNRQGRQDKTETDRQSEKLGLIDVLLDIMVSVLHYLTLPAIIPLAV